jgi:hypothetical protein
VLAASGAGNSLTQPGGPTNQSAVATSVGYVQQPTNS